jgi:hypothetical protein
LKQRGYIELDAPHWFAVSQEHWLDLTLPPVSGSALIDGSTCYKALTTLDKTSPI